MKVLINVIKNIFCVQKYSDNCNKCSLCHLIDIGNLPTLKIITPSGKFITKDQIIELREIFSKSSQITDKSIYVIKECEKMNKESANTMLKFLEEPEGNVIGFFITNDYNNVIPTIKSRCQHLDINFSNNEYESLNIEEDKYNELFNITKDYLEKLEVEKKELILYNKTYLDGLEREDIKCILKIILEIYKDELDGRYITKNKKYELEFLKNLSNKNLKNKIDLLIEILKELSYNTNQDLLLDRFVVEMDGINNESL